MNNTSIQYVAYTTLFTVITARDYNKGEEISYSRLHNHEKTSKKQLFLPPSGLQKMVSPHCRDVASFLQ